MTTQPTIGKPAQGRALDVLLQGLLDAFGASHLNSVGVRYVGPARHAFIGEEPANGHVFRIGDDLHTVVVQ